MIQAGGAGKKALEKAFEDVLGEKDVWQDLNPDGRTDEWIFEELHIKRFGSAVPEALKKILIESYIHHLSFELPLSAHYRILPYVTQILETLSKDPQNILGLATGNFEKAAYLKLQRGKLDHYFTFGGFGSDSVHRQELTKKALERACNKIGGDPEVVYVIGDTIYDIECGKGIGAKTVAVCTGGTSKEKLANMNPTFLVDHVGVLLDMLNGEQIL
ncbi:MAG: hydrolase [uncultured bacterium]|nr:MAG: hydrolase [uncultured bacterium]